MDRHCIGVGKPLPPCISSFKAGSLYNDNNRRISKTHIHIMFNV